MHRKCTGQSQVQFRAFDGADVTSHPFECPRLVHCNDGMFDWSVPLHKLKNNPSPATVWHVQEVLNIYSVLDVVPAKMMSTSATKPGAEDATALAVLKLYQAAWIHRCRHMSSLNMVDAGS